MTTTPQRFTKRPVTIEAIQWDGTKESASHILDWMFSWAIDRGASANYMDSQRTGGEPLIAIETLEGTMLASSGDWIIRGVQGEFYPCRDDIFRQTYEAVEDES